jgi:hypothetical protein
MKSWIARCGLLAALVASASLLGGCQATKEVYADTFYKGTTLSYDQYLSQDVESVPPVTADSLIEALGDPADVYDRDGVRRRIEYNAFSMTGDLKRAEFHFDRDEKLVKKELW